MPIEIKELSIKINVEKQSESTDVSIQETDNNVDADEINTIIDRKKER